jgi:hypothetical protein
MHRHLLLNSRWTMLDNNSELYYEFARQEDRMRYFEKYLEAWMVPMWLYLSAPYMINIHWLYWTDEHADPVHESIRKALCQILKERFLQLVDATYIYLIDQLPGTPMPMVDQSRSKEKVRYSQSIARHLGSLR